jgi:glucokinase
MSDKYVYAGIDIGGTNIKYGLTDRNGHVLFKDRRPTMVEKGADPLLHLITNISETLLYHAADEEFEVKWLGVGTPGAVDAKTGKILGQSPNIDGWCGTELGQILAERLNMPVLVDNDVNTMAVAEARFGAAVGYSSVICVALGTGVGGGIILDGKLWRGSNHAAGEVGHITLNADGDPCKSHMPGCLESLCSSSAIIERCKHKLKNDLSPIFKEVLEGSIENINIKRIFTAVKKGDDIAQSVMDETARYLGIGLAGVVNLINPEIVVIGGGIADGGGGFVESVSAHIRKYACEPATENLRVARATLGNDAGFIGAGILGEVVR